MTDETRDLLQIQLSVLKETMKQEGVILRGLESNSFRKAIRKESEE